MRETGRTVLSVVDDIFFAAKLQAVAEAAGIRLIEARTFEEFRTQASSSIPDLVVVDLNSVACRPLEVIGFLKSDRRLGAVPIVGFLSHVQVDLEKAAKAAGCDRVIPRSRFASQLAGLLAGAV